MELVVENMDERVSDERVELFEGRIELEVSEDTALVVDEATELVSDENTELVCEERELDSDEYVLDSNDTRELVEDGNVELVVIKLVLKLVELISEVSVEVE